MQQLARELLALSRRWRATMDGILKPFGITFAGWQVLESVWLSQSGLTQVQIAQEICVEPSTLTHQLDLLVAQDLIERFSVPGDRRANLIRLSSHADTLMEEVSRVLADENARMADTFGRERLAEAKTVVRELSARLASGALATPPANHFFKRMARA